jgi:transposase
MNKGNARVAVVGIDQGDRFSHVCMLNRQGQLVKRERVRTTPSAYEAFFGRLPPARVVLEIGPQSVWSSRLLEQLGHEVVVANPRKVKAFPQAERKSDPRDAETLARLGLGDLRLLEPIRHGRAAMQRERALLRVREGLVRCRARVIQQARGWAKALGEPLPRCDTRAFARRMREGGWLERLPAMPALCAALDALCVQIDQLDREVERACAQRHPVTAQLRQVSGVGPLTALAFVTTIEAPARFAKSRDVGPYLGLVPRKHQSGDEDPPLGVPRRGDAMLRRLLLQSAHYILGPFGADSDLRRFGQAMAARGGNRAKKRAVIALARKLAVLLHRLWVTGEVYQPIGYAQANAQLPRSDAAVQDRADARPLRGFVLDGCVGSQPR